MTKIQKYIFDYCKKHSKTLTATRLLVFNTMSTYNKPKSAYKIKSDIEKNGKKYNISTVYRVIDFLVEIGVVHKLPTLNKYFLCKRPHDKHTHILNFCVKCEKVYETCNVEMGISWPIINSGQYKMRVNTNSAIEIPVLCSSCS